jgi:hypothetical protein
MYGECQLNQQVNSFNGKNDYDWHDESRQQTMSDSFVCNSVLERVDPS